MGALKQHRQEKRDVWANGGRTSSGLTRKDLFKTKDGRIVSKARHFQGIEQMRWLKREGLWKPLGRKKSRKSRSRSRSRSRR